MVAAVLLPGLRLVVGLGLLHLPHDSGLPFLSLDLSLWQLLLLLQLLLLVLLPLRLWLEQAPA